MDTTFTDINFFEVIKIILVIGVLVIFILYIRAFGGYKINKPFSWEVAVNNRVVSKELVNIEKGFKDKVRFYNIWFQVKSLQANSISGSFAELGVYQGETAKAIHFMAPNRVFYLFDTFEGFTEADLSKESRESLKEGRFSTHMFADTNIGYVKDYIKGNDNLQFRPGIFPETAKGLENEQFAFVNIDADLYVPTIEALHFFYPRLSNSGVILIHDYNHNWDGVNKAVKEFIPKIPESLIELSDWQGSAMIIKNG
jgi:O-methyltransferase